MGAFAACSTALPVGRARFSFLFGMILARSLILGFPLLVAALAWWSADVSRRSRQQRGRDDIVVMLPQKAPALNPFLSVNEAEREIADLVHEPLLRLGADGTLQPALADVWRWSQEVTCWFADAATARRAHERLLAQIGEHNRWLEWRLSAARVQENKLRLTFTDTAASGVRQALQAVVELAPQPVTFWRAEARQPLRAAWDRFAAASPSARQVHAVWFDGANACELIVPGHAPQLLADLQAAFNAATGDSCSLTPLGEAGALVEPVLDLDIRPGCHWHDGTAVTAEDARATLDYLLRSDVPLPEREALRHIQSVEAREDGARLHIVFRRRYGPSLGMFAGFPVLPAAWLRAHPQATPEDFLQHPPPGAGGHRVAARDARSLILVPTGSGRETARFLFNFDASPLMTQVGVRTRTVDLVWPAAAAGQSQTTPCLTPPRQRLVVLWNMRHAALASVEVRKALARATDSAALIRTLPGSLGPADGSLFAPGLWFSTKAAREPFDLKEARRVLSSAGWTRDVEGVARNAAHALRFKLLVPGGDALHRGAAEQLVAQWQRLGARVEVEAIEDAPTLLRRLRAHQFDAVLLDQRFEISWDQLPWWHSSQAVAGGTNFCGVADPQIDLRLEALAGEFDPARVPTRVRELEALLLPLHPMLTLFSTHEAAAMVSTALRPALGRASWTLRSLAEPAPLPTPVVPKIEFKLRTTDG